MKLFIANTTKQNHDFLYTLPEDKPGRVRMQQIPAGGQVRIHSANASSDELEHIIRQHEQYGLVKSDEIDRATDFIGLCYSFDREINVEKILYADEHNNDVLIDRGIQIREDTLAVMGMNMESSEDRTGELLNLETEVIEEKRPGGGSDTTRLEEKRQLVRPGRENKASKPRRR